MIVSEAELIVHLGYGDDLPPQEHAALQSIHSQSEDAVKRYIGYNPEQATHVEYYPRRTHAGGLGNSYEGYWDSNDTHAYYRSTATVQSSLQLHHLPVRKINKLYVNYDGRFGANADVFDIGFDPEVPGSSGNATEWIYGTDFWGQFTADGFCGSGILLANQGWSTEPGSIKIEYVAGYSASELSGRADAQAAARDAESGIITSPTVSAAGLARAVILTAIGGMHTWQAMKRNNSANSQTSGFSGGNTFQSERLQDYSYTRPSEKATSQLVGMMVDVPREAQKFLQSFKHFGLSRL